MSTSPTVELEISALSHDGRGIAFLSGPESGRGKALFIANALPGQKVLCRPGTDHGSWQEADLVSVLDAGANTVPPICPQADLCGGCPLQAMPYDRQLRWKEKILLDSMNRIGGYDKAELAAVWQGLESSPDLRAFRNKIELAFALDDQGKPYPGMRKRSSHEVVPISRCALMDAEANEILANFCALLNKWQWPQAFWRFLVLRRDEDEAARSRWRLIAISAPSKAQYAKVRDFATALIAREKRLFAFIYETRRHPSMIAKGEQRIFSLGKDGSADASSLATLSLPLGGRTFNTDAASFFQVNGKASEKLAELVVRADSRCQSKKNLLDLYCGCGAPGLLLAPAYERYLGVELDAAAIQWARHNARDLPHCQFQAGDAAKLIARLQQSPANPISTLLLDPPRSGLDRRVTDSILKMAPENIIMVSCNPSTLARDARMLAKDYTLQSLAGVDLFPHTPHIEACALWKHK